MNHVTAFHYVVAENNEYALDLLLDHDRPVALSGKCICRSLASHSIGKF